MERALKELNPNLKHGSTAFNANSFTPSKDAYSVQQGVFAKEDRESSQVGMFTIVGTQQTLGTTSAPQLQAKKNAQELDGFPREQRRHRNNMKAAMQLQACRFFAGRKCNASSTWTL